MKRMLKRMLSRIADWMRSVIDEEIETLDFFYNKQYA